jgi:hypothetical protein
MPAEDKSNQKRHPNGRHDGRYPTRHGRPKRGEATHVRAARPEPASGYLARGAWQVGEMARGHEGSAVVLALVAGFGCGVLIGGTLAATYRQRESWGDRWMAEGIGRRLLDRIEAMIPATISEHLGH